MRWKEIIRDYLTFSRKDSIAVVVLLLLLFLIMISPAFFKSKNKNKTTPTENNWAVAVKKLEQTNSPGKDSDEIFVRGLQYDRRESNYPPSRGNLFFFDPNKISADDWKELGLRDKTIRTIQNYLSKGGRFKRKEDLQKIYGLHQNEYERLEPYIRISANNGTFFSTPEKKDNPPAGATAFKKSYSPVDINTADTTAFIQLPGIGSKLADRIVNFRNKLGGFYAVEQIKETYGLPDSTYQKIKAYLRLESNGVKRINLNTASLDDLKAHPYIKYNIGNAIIAYRNEHGQFSTIADLKKIMLITDEIFQKIEPYLTLNL